MKHNIKKRIAAILCALTLSFPVSNWVTSGDGQNIASATVCTYYLNPYLVNQYCDPIPHHVQYGNYSCWSYVLRSLTVYKTGYYPSDYELANLANNYTALTGLTSLYPAPYGYTPVSPVDYNISSAAYTYVVQNYFPNAFKISYIGIPLSDSYIASNINNDKPIIMFCQSSSGGHILLLYGFYASDIYGNNISCILAYDPIGGVTRMIPKDVSGNYTFTGNNGLTYTWHDSIVI